MTILSTDIKYRKSVVQTDTSANGGRMGNIQVISGVRHALFPRVTKSQRDAGVTHYRKEFWCNENASDESGYGVLNYLMAPSNAGDTFYLAKGTQNDTQADFDRNAHPYARTWEGAGQLETALSGGETSVSLDMEDTDFMFPNGGKLWLSDILMTAQTVDAGVVAGDSVYYSSGSWSKVTHIDNITYPYGWAASSTTVISKQETTNEEFLEVATNQYSGEVIGTGNGSNTAPTLATLTNKINGVCRQADWLPVVTATCGAIARTADIDCEGGCTGYCSAGNLNMANGAWTTPITWTTAPDNATNITIVYYENAWSWSGNVATVELAEQVTNAYPVAATFGAGCIETDEVACETSVWTEASASGTYDETSYPLTMYNDGTVYETWTLTFSSASAFSVAGAYYGSVGSGNTSSDFSPNNIDMGQPYFTINSNGWGGTWTSGDTIVFNTVPSAVPMLLCQHVPAGTAAESNNLLPVGNYTE
ncbi:MAG: hypothetical protein AUJ12_00440 [Alphaproteobacteria bacterium CG1_02_46_17]|nr:MAG: hypothetical protein AUJ12_00440 [Alphaproteobacteria bacterium CG1_02_46_17]